jgi:SPP1 family holin
MKYNERHVSRETVIRTVVLMITLINWLLAITGKKPMPFVEDDVYTGLTITSTLVATIWAGWKNNSFTKLAIEADFYLKDLRKKQKYSKLFKD